MTRQVDFKAEHIKMLIDQPHYEYMKPYISEETMAALERQPYVSSIEAEGKIVVAGGVSMYWHGRGEAWAFYDANLPKHLYPRVHKIMRMWFDLCPVRRIEAAIDIGDEIGMRRTEMLGFTLEAPLLRKFRPDGKDCALYARVK
jgi:hypothetical protein